MTPTTTTDQRTTPATGSSPEKDPLHLIDVDHVRFCVGNAKQAAVFYASTFGFRITQLHDLTCGARSMARYMLEQGNIRFILETPMNPDHPANDELRKYGDGIKDIAFNVHDAESAYARAIANGAISSHGPETFSDGDGSMTTASIKTYGRVVHTFVSRTGRYALPELKQGGLFMPGWKHYDCGLNQYNLDHPCGLKFVDHCVGNVEEGKMNEWVKWYEDALEFSMFKHFDDADISTEHSALMSKVMASGNHLIKMPINEPADGLKKSQIQEYLDWHDNTPGCQHLALRTDDELASVAELRRRGVDFLQLPDTYYELVWDRVNNVLREHGHEPVKEDHERIKELGILVDADDEGYLLQLFTKPLQDRPTMFFEIISRMGSQSFGKGNFKALFEALEMEQDRRGNL